MNKLEIKPQINWEERKVAINSLKPALYNPRKLNKKAKEPFMRNLDNFGNLEPIVVNQDMTIIGGHMRYNIFLERGDTEIEVSYPDKLLSPEEEKKLNVILNSVGGQTNLPKLLTMGLSIEELNVLGFDELKAPTQKNIDSTPELKTKNPNVRNLYFFKDDFFFVQEILQRIQKKESGVDSQAQAVLFLIKQVK